jgi:hypothetical protein
MDRNTARSAFAPTRSQSLRSPFGPRSCGRMRTARGSRTFAPGRWLGRSHRGRGQRTHGRPAETAAATPPASRRCRRARMPRYPGAPPQVPTGSVRDPFTEYHRPSFRLARRAAHDDARGTNLDSLQLRRANVVAIEAASRPLSPASISDKYFAGALRCGAPSSTATAPGCSFPSRRIVGPHSSSQDCTRTNCFGCSTSRGR